MSFLASSIRSTILVTGGGSGIGLALAKRLSNRGHDVIVVGRNQQKLDQAKAECPELTTFQGDVSSESGRIAIRDKLTEYPNLNVLINNAGENTVTSPLWKATDDDWMVHKKLIATNLEAPMHLSMLILPTLLKQPHSLIVNVSAIVAFAPLATAPSYSAAKAGLHSFSLSLRHQLKQSNVGVVEIVPPMVATDFIPTSLHRIAAKLDPFADHVMEQLLQDKEEITYKMEKIVFGSREDTDKFFKSFNPTMKIH